MSKENRQGEVSEMHPCGKEIECTICSRVYGNEEHQEAIAIWGTERPRQILSAQTAWVERSKEAQGPLCSLLHAEGRQTEPRGSGARVPWSIDH